MWEAVAVFVSPVIETKRSNVLALTSYSMIAVPVAVDVVAGTSCAALIVARSSMIWARAAVKAAKRTDTNNNPRIVAFFMGGRGRSPGGNRRVDHSQEATCWPPGVQRPSVT